MEKGMSHISHGNNIWKYVHPTFHPYAPSFKGLTTTDGIIKNQQMVADTLADYYEKHFQTTTFDPTNQIHIDASKTFKDFSRLPNISLEKVSLEGVEKNWKRVQQKKSTDTEGISAFLLHQLPTEYLQIVTIAFNKIAQSGIVLRKSKHAKVICLSKDGLYPAVDKLRPISLLSNFGKSFERIIHTRILKWCNDKGIFTDEQSGFTSERRLQTRILSLVEDLRLTTAADNRPSLVIFVDFVPAFDKNVAPCTSYHTSQTRHSVTTTTVDFSVAQRKNNVNPCWRSGFTCYQHLCWQTSRFSPCRYSFSSTCPFPPIIFYEPSLPLICGRSGYNYLWST
ncbi:unnamed protein product [Rotaria socialis]|uniref:Reverse transcriptase domain-containing protein n=1 Tax=Rotaria socialis TaxID=392032 RepID=A0A821TTL1_9BILA|nr:unnamed protein product [Rotaria socialis]